ncbi:MAG: hypothetical protein WBV73_15470, partial [Phormidium sp.]
VSAAQPTTPAVPAIANSQFEQIFNDIQQLELAGRQMEYLRNNGDLAQCGSKMREYQKQAENLVDKTKYLPHEYIALGSAAGSLWMCVSCSSSAQDSCDRVADDLNYYKLIMSEE